MNQANMHLYFIISLQGIAVAALSIYNLTSSPFLLLVKKWNVAVIKPFIMVATINFAHHLFFALLASFIFVAE